MEWHGLFRDFTILFMAMTQLYLAVNFYKVFKIVVQDIKGQRDEFFSLLRHSVDTIKSKSLEERVKAHSAEKQHKVQMELMRDAFSEELKQEKPKEPDPVLAKTEHGIEINMREYDIL